MVNGPSSSLATPSERPYPRGLEATIGNQEIFLMASIDAIEEDIRLCEEYLARDRAQIDDPGEDALHEVTRSTNPCLYILQHKISSEWASRAAHIDKGDLRPPGDYCRKKSKIVVQRVVEPSRVRDHWNFTEICAAADAGNKTIDAAFDEANKALQYLLSC